MDDRRKIEAIAAARREIARRIARFCTSLTPEEFDRLLDRMASVQWKYDVLPVVAESHPPLEQIRDLNRESQEYLQDRSREP
jgi:hypothetical protein